MTQKQTCREKGLANYLYNLSTQIYVTTKSDLYFVIVFFLATQFSQKIKLDCSQLFLFISRFKTIVICVFFYLFMH